MIDFSAPLAGLASATASVAQSARRIASAGSPAAAGAGDTVDLSAEMVALMSAKNLAQASVNVARVADEVAQATLSILA
jgi:hypothetical protein